MKKIILIVIGIILLVALVLAAFGFVVIQKLNNDIGLEVVQRVASPDAKVDFILLEINGGAPTPYTYQLFIVPHDAPFDPKKAENPLLDGEHLNNLKIYWASSHQLNIQYDTARIYTFSNFWESKEVDDYNYHIDLMLLPSSLCKNSLTANSLQ